MGEGVYMKRRGVGLPLKPPTLRPTQRLLKVIIIKVPQVLVVIIFV
jgi:hypothetical protein